MNPSSIEIPTAGSSYSITCAALETVNGLTDVIGVQWIGPDGSTIDDGGGITIQYATYGNTSVTLTMRYDSIYTSHGGQYTCRAELYSPALTVPFVTILSYNVSVLGRYS